MQRRSFIKLSLAACATLVLPSVANAATAFTANDAQTIVVFTYGGASQLAGNLTNLPYIRELSTNDYNYFGTITPTVNNKCWSEAGGDHMETMMAAGDMTIFRSCFSQARDDADSKAHGICTKENQKGAFDSLNQSGGIVTNLGKILSDFGAIDLNTKLPFITFEGNSLFYLSGTEPFPAYIRPAGLDADFSNPYTRARIPVPLTDPDPFNAEMDSLSQSYNSNVDIKRAFEERAGLSEHIATLTKEAELLSTTNAYTGNTDIPANSDIAGKLETAINIMHLNPDTKVITMGTSGGGGWDDHNNAIDYVDRSMELFASLKSAVAHMNELGKTNLSIVVFCEFGRNVNLNAANGWDHGNLQNLYVFGGKDYLSHKGVVGETQVVDEGENRLFLKPVGPHIEPFSIAATLYKIFGYTDDANILTDGHAPINIFS